MLNLNRFPLFGLLMVASVVVGCGSKPPAGSVAVAPADESSSHAEHGEPDPRAIAEGAIAEAFAPLSPEDRVLAEAQKFCAIATENPLGSMGTPLKIEVNGESVFLCCAGCKGKALRNPEETLASVAKLKSENSVNK